MPWKTSDVRRHNRHVKSAKRKRQWIEVANSVLEKTGDEGRAIRSANSVVKKAQAKKKVSATGHNSKSKHSRKARRKKISGKR